MDKMLTLNCEPAFLNSIFLTIISNAIIYQDFSEKLVINISASIKDKTLKISVLCSGLEIGIIKNGNKIFQSFEYFHENKETNGLGLFLVKKKIEEMNGVISLTSKENEGAKFLITIPILHDNE